MDYEKAIVEHIRSHGPSKASEIARAIDPDWTGPLAQPGNESPVWRKLNGLTHRMGREGKLVSLGAGRYALPGQASPPEHERAPTWQEEVVNRMLAMSAGAFERLVAMLLESSGVYYVKTSGNSNASDAGVDGSGSLIAGPDKLPVLFQAKRWSRTVSASVVRDFRGAVQGRGHVGMIFTTGKFSADARQEADRTQAVDIRLYDGMDMAEWMKDREMGVKTTRIVIEESEVDEDWWESLNDE